MDAHLKKEAQKIAVLYLKGDTKKQVMGWLVLADELHETIAEMRQRQQKEEGALREGLAHLATSEQELRSLLDTYPKAR